MKQLSNRATLPGFIAILVLSACGQAPSPNEQQLPAQRAKVSPIVPERLQVTALSELGGTEKGREVYVRVAVDEKPLPPSTDVAQAGWAESSPGIYLYVGSESAAPATLEWEIPAASSRALYFSSTEYSGKVQVTWKGMTATYDLASAPGGSPKPPIDLNSPLPPGL